MSLKTISEYDPELYDVIKETDSKSYWK